MARHLRTVKEKLATKIKRISDPKIIVTARQVRIGSKILFRYSENEIQYGRNRYFPTLKEDLVEEDFSVTVILSHQSLPILSTAIHNPPRGAKKVIDMVRYYEPGINKIVVGSDVNKIEGSTVYVTVDFYDTLTSINREEGKDKVIRVRNRVAPFLTNDLSIQTDEVESERDYSLLAKEIIASKQLSQADIAAMADELESGELNRVVIDKQINKQAEWLLNTMQKIVDEGEITKTKAREFGNEYFGYLKKNISGPEDLMEKILTDYGQNTIFGVPALLNTNKYVVSSGGFSRSQFDLLLITNLSDIEIVELKRTDELLFEYDSNRGKFYISKTLGIATAQCERYISAIYRENDSDFKIDGKTIREFIESEFGGTITLSVCRPRALIVIGAIHRLAKLYEELSDTAKSKVTKAAYEKNLDHAYKELKSAYKNVEITTYSELIEGARLRLQIDSDGE